MMLKDYRELYEQIHNDPVNTTAKPLRDAGLDVRDTDTRDVVVMAVLAHLLGRIDQLEQEIHYGR